MSILPESRHTAGPGTSGEALPGVTLALAGLDVAAAAWITVYSLGLGRSGTSMDGIALSTLLVLALLFVSVVSLVSGGVRAESKLVRRVLPGATITLAVVITTLFTLAYAALSRS